MHYSNKLGLILQVFNSRLLN